MKNPNGQFDEAAYGEFLAGMAERYDFARIDKDSMPCNKPRRDIQGGKKSVVKACKDGKEKVIRFGDAKMSIKKHIKGRRENFRARHNCDQKKDKFTAGYWSCKAW